jgi:hypothetical protein
MYVHKLFKLVQVALATKLDPRLSFEGIKNIIPKLFVGPRENDRIVCSPACVIMKQVHFYDEFWKYSSTNRVSKKCLAKIGLRNSFMCRENDNISLFS